METSNGAAVADGTVEVVDWKARAERYKRELDLYRAAFTHVGDGWASARAILDEDGVV